MPGSLKDYVLTRDFENISDDRFWGIAAEKPGRLAQISNFTTLGSVPA
jgi:hypothetical protein